MFRDFTDESLYTEDWNEGEHPLRHLPFLVKRLESGLSVFCADLKYNKVKII